MALLGRRALITLLGGSVGSGAGEDGDVEGGGRRVAEGGGSI